MSELRVDNIVSENGTAPPIYSKGLRIGSGQTLTNNGDYVVDGSTTLSGPTTINSSVNITNTGVTTVAGTFNVDGAGQSTIAGDVEVTGALNVLGGGTLNTTGIITASDLNITNSFSYQNLSVSGVSTLAQLEVTGFGTFNSDIYVSGIATFNSDIYVSGIGSFNSIGIGTTSPDAALHVVDDILVSAGAAATLDIRIKAYDDELGAISFEGATDATQYFSVTKDLSTILFGVNDENLDTVFTVNANSSTNVRFGSVAEKLSIIDGNTVNITYESSTGTNIGVCTNPTGDITLNVTNIPTTSDFDNCSISFSVFVTQTGTARSCTAVTLNGYSSTIHWSGGSLGQAIVVGSSTTIGMDIYSFTGINTVGSASTTANYYLIGSVNGGYS